MDHVFEIFCENHIWWIRIWEVQHFDLKFISQVDKLCFCSVPRSTVAIQSQSSWCKQKTDTWKESVMIKKMKGICHWLNMETYCYHSVQNLLSSCLLNIQKNNFTWNIVQAFQQTIGWERHVTCMLNMKNSYILLWKFEVKITLRSLGNKWHDIKIIVNIKKGLREQSRVIWIRRGTGFTLTR